MISATFRVLKVVEERVTKSASVTAFSKPLLWPAVYCVLLIVIFLHLDYLCLVVTVVNADQFSADQYRHYLARFLEQTGFHVLFLMTWHLKSHCWECFDTGLTSADDAVCGRETKCLCNLFCLVIVRDFPASAWRLIFVMCFRIWGSSSSLAVTFLQKVPSRNCGSITCLALLRLTVWFPDSSGGGSAFILAVTASLIPSSL